MVLPHDRSDKLPEAGQGGSCSSAGGKSRTPVTSDCPGSPLEVALALHAAGHCVIPIKPDGSKKPIVAWKRYQKERPSVRDLRTWFGPGQFGLAILGGRISGNHETIDFDDGSLFHPWRELVEQQAPGLVARLCVITTPRIPAGFHVRYRCTEVTIPGNTDLARAQEVNPDTGELLCDPKGRPKVKATIQTRGEGGYALVPGTPASCHKTGGLYRHLSGPSLTELGAISASEREILWSAARSFNLWIDDSEVHNGPGTGKTAGTALRPGDEYNRAGPDWPQILEPAGWDVVHHRGDVTYWRRPDKSDPGWSATTGFCTSKDGYPLFAVFSSSAYPFQLPAGKTCGCFTKFAVYTLLNHAGDFTAAARALGQMGYGEKRRHQGTGGGNQGSKSKDFFAVGTLTLQPGPAHRTPSGKLSVPVAVRRNDCLVDHVTLSSTPSARTSVGKHLARAYLTDTTLQPGELDQLLASIIVQAAQALDSRAGREGPRICDVVRREVVQALRLAYRTDRGAWSEARGCEIGRGDFLAFTPPDLLDAAAAGVDAPRDMGGATVRPALLLAVKTELEILWADLIDKLPRAPAADLTAGTEAAARFREQLVRLWTAPVTFEVAKDNAGADVASRASLVSRVRSQAGPHRRGQAVPGERNAWRAVHPAYAAWWRPHAHDDGEVGLLLAMRWELQEQIRVGLPGVHDQVSLTTLGDRYGVLDQSQRVVTRLSGGTRLAVLEKELTEELMEVPTDKPEDAPETQ